MSLVGCVLVAGGSGSRLGQDRPKALVEVGGATLLEHAAGALATRDPASGAPVVGRLVVVAPAEALSRCAELVDGAWRAAGRTDRPVVVAGGADRQSSVRAGLAALDPGCEVVLVHDAARAFTPAGVVAAVVAAVLGGQEAVVPGLPVTDTVKRLAPLDLAGLRPGAGRAVAGTLERSSLVSVQTPQGFRADLLRAVHGLDGDRDRVGGPVDGAPRRGSGAGDDAGMVEAAGGTVTVVPGHPEAFKVTVPFDLLVAEALLARRHRAAGPDAGGDRLPG